MRENRGKTTERVTDVRGRESDVTEHTVVSADRGTRHGTR